MNMRQRYHLIAIIVVAVILLLLIKHPSPCQNMADEREQNSTILATLDRNDIELAQHIMNKNATLYDEMQRQRCSISQ